MSNNQTKPRPRPRTVEEWREIRKERYRNGGKSGGWRILPRKVLYSDAFNELSKSAKLALILSLDQLDHWTKKEHKGQSYRETSIGRLRNDGRFSLPNNLMIEYGIKSSHTISRVRKELVAAGFWETVEAGTLYQSGVFRWSDNWLRYNQKPVAGRKRLDDSALAPGYCHYPNIIAFNQLKQAAADTDQCSDTLAVQLAPAVLPGQPMQLCLFDELAGDDDTEEYCRAAKAV
jgi:hypothetical protein